MTSAPWRIETADGDVYADGLLGPLFDTAPGSQITVTLHFRAVSEYGEPIDRHDELQPFVDAAVDDVTIRTGESNTGRPYYRERLEGQPAESLLVALVPLTEGYSEDGYGGAYGGVRDRGGVWAVLRDGSDDTLAVERGLFAWNLELTVLQRYGGEDRADVEAAFSEVLV